MSVRNVYNSLTLLLPHADDSMGQIYADYDAVIHKSKKILHQVTHELIPAAGYFTQDSLDTFLALIPIVFRNAIAMHRANPKAYVRKSHLVEHQASSGVERFAYTISAFLISSPFSSTALCERNALSRVWPEQFSPMIAEAGTPFFKSTSVKNSQSV